jgi:hypothetical protein
MSRFVYTPFPEDRSEARALRLLRMLPAGLSWLIILGLTACCAAAPSVGAALVIAFLLYYLLRVLYNAVFLVVSFMRVNAEERSDWPSRLRDLVRLSGREMPSPFVRPAAPAPPARFPRITRAFNAAADRLGRSIHEQVMECCRAPGAGIPSMEGLVHLVIIPVSTEKPAVYEPGIRALADGILDPARFIIVVLAVEERFGPESVAAAEAVRDRHAGRFRDFRVIAHPADLPREVPGKGSNVDYTCRRMADYFTERSVDFADVVLTCIDADAMVCREYFAALSYYYLAEPNRVRACFQPVPVFGNNIWAVPSLVRVVEMSSTIFRLIDMTNCDPLVTYYCYSYSFAGLAAAGFWPKEVVAEDEAIFWKTWLHFRGDFRSIPLPVTVNLDAPEASGFKKTLRAAYKQKVRYNYGSENIAIVFRALYHHRLIPLRRRLGVTVKMLENNISLSTWPFILSFLVWLPQVYHFFSPDSPLPVFNLARISAVIFGLSSIFLVLLIAATGFYVYRRSAGVPLWKKLLYPLEWFVIFPVASIFFGGLPALQGQTRVAFGRPLVFVTTEKLRRPAQPPGGPRAP